MHDTNQIQATTNQPATDSPCILGGQDRKARITFNQQPTSHLPHLVNQAPEHGKADDLNRAALIAALPEAVDHAMRKTLPDKYTPELAAAIAAAATAELRNPQPADCPTWCDRSPDSHEDPTERIHHGPFKAMHGTYDDSGDGLMAFHLRQVNGDKPGIDFVGHGDWPTLDLPQVDELIEDMAAHLADLRATRAQLAQLLANTTSATTA